MRGRPSKGWFVTHVDEHDARVPGMRPARVLLERSDGEGWFVPVAERGDTLYGHELACLDDVGCPDSWLPVARRLPWAQGYVPVVRSNDPLAIEFVSPTRVERGRRQRASECLLEAFRPGDAYERLGALELVDGLLGRPSLGSAGMIALAEEIGTAVGPLGEVRRRLRGALRSRTAALESVLDDPAFARIRADTRITSRLLSAALGLGEAALEGSWSDVEARVRAGLDGLPGLGEGALIRGTWQALAPALGRFADEIGLFARRSHNISVLERWDRSRSTIGEIGQLTGGRAWQSARWAAEELRRSLLPVDPQSPISMHDLLEGIGGLTAGVGFPRDVRAAAWSDGESGPWVAFLSKKTAESHVGVRRFAIAHQLGHVVAGDPPATCSVEIREQTHPGSEWSEAFANAFALYLLAPAQAVCRLVVHIPDDLALREAAADVALQFGITPGAALPHLLNALSIPDVEKASSRARQAPEHPEWNEAVRAEVAEAWKAEESWFVEQLGESNGAPGLRPVTRRRDELLEHAIGALDATEVETLDLPDDRRGAVTK